MWREENAISSNSILELKGMLYRAELHRSTLILGRIHELLGDSDHELLVTLAIRLFNLGEDEKAEKLTARALAISGRDISVLKLQLFISVANAQGAAEEQCSELRSLLPEDQWVSDICKKLRMGDVGSISLPALENQWERLISGEPCD